MEAPYLPPRLFIRNFTTSSISITLSASSSPITQSTSISTSPTSHSTTLTTSSPTSQSTPLTTSSSRTTPSTSSFSSSTALSKSTTFSSTILLTSTTSFSPIPTITPTPTPTPTPKPSTPPPTHKTSNIPLYIGIALSLVALLALIILLVRLESYLHRRRQRSKLLSSIPLNPHEGLRTLHLPQIIQSRHHNTNKKGNRRSRQEFSDGRRFGVVRLGLDAAGEELQVQTEEMGRRNREHFEAWKRKRGFADLRDEVVLEDLHEGNEERGRGTGRERRETFDAWKRGVVPPPRGEGNDIGLGTKVVGGERWSVERNGEEEGRHRDGYDMRKQRQVVDDDMPTTGQGSSI